MSQDEFSFSAVNEENPDNGQAHAACAAVCPLSRIPASVWLRIIRPPFRKRHPFIFWPAMIILVALLASICHVVLSDKDLLEDRIALVTIKGPIMDVAPLLEWIRKIEKNPSVKGVLLRVDSPGGGAAASQEIYAALARLAKKMPIAASMGATAASGGLMVSMAGQRIFANPSTITGSIGVRMDIPQLQGLMGKIGIGQETLVTAPYKNAASYTKPLTEQDRAYLEKVLKNMHDQFVDIVAAGRRMPREKAATLASGKIFTGQEALGLGLVDELGGQSDALEWLARKTGVPPERKLLAKPSDKRRFWEIFTSLARITDFYMDHIEKAASFSENWNHPVFMY